LVGGIIIFDIPGFQGFIPITIPENWGFTNYKFAPFNNKLYEKRIFFVIIGLIGFGSLIAQINDSVLVSHYGSIRADMTRDVCRIAGIDSAAILKLISNESLVDFKKNIKDNNLRKIFDSAKPLSGNDFKSYDQNIRETRKIYVSHLQNLYPEKTADVNNVFLKYIPRISLLTSECEVLSEDAQNNYANYLQLYPNGQLRHLISVNGGNHHAGPIMNNETSKKDKNENLGVLLPIIFISIIAICAFLYWKYFRKKKDMKLQIDEKNEEPAVVVVENPTNSEEKSESDTDRVIVQEEIATVDDPPAPPKKKIQLNPEGHAMAIDADNLIIVGASVQGNGHLKRDIPCQDNHAYEYLQDGWGIAIVSDGAGSAKYSQIGSAFVVNRAMAHFKQLITAEEWIKKGVLPSDIDWEKKAYKALRTVRDEMDLLSQKRDCSIKDLNATIIVIIHSPFGILATHIGDGRAGYKDKSGEWFSIITPHKGEESNQTIFIPSDFWNIPFFEMKGITVPESRVIRDEVSAFTLMSDGCEKTSWLCNQFNEETGKYYDPNKPYKGFFDPLVETLISFRSDNDPLTEREEKWYRFIKSGNESFEIETDDKTMILATIYQ
jgi:hypothetical protein